MAVSPRAALMLSAALALSLIALAVATRGHNLGGRPADRDAPWEIHIRAIDEALARRDVGAASRSHQEAYVAAIASRRWEGLVESGDAARRIADVANVRQPYLAKARSNYLGALFRARAAGSADGAVRVCEAFVDAG